MPYVGLLVLVAVIALAPPVSAAQESRGWPNERPAAEFSPEDDKLLDEIQQAAFRFFVEQADPVTGLVRDRARSDGTASEGMASIAASGFSLSAWAVAVQHGWVDRDRALVQTRKALHFLAEKAPRRHGFFYHFMEMKTGERAWNCEVSPIDTGLFFAGAILAREYFQDPEVTGLVNGLIRDVDWEWFLNGGSTLAMAWHDETGFSRYRWDKYAEDMLLGFLGMGAVERPLPVAYWDSWKRMPVGSYAGLHFIEGPQLFIHQFTHAYVDFRGLRDAYADYFRNSVLASLAQRRFCVDLRGEYPSWGERLWGITSSDSADGYKAWGGPPRTTDANALDGTIAPCAAAGSVPFVPSEAMQTLRYMRTAFDSRIWSRYGFVDAFNPETGWVDPDVVGIDLGISLLQAENARTGFVWAVFMQAPEVKRALGRAGFVSQNRTLAWAQLDRFHELAVRTWASLDSEQQGPDDLGLRLSSILSASALGIIPENDAVKRLEEAMEKGTRPSGDRALSAYAAALVTVRNAVPALATLATQKLSAIDWHKVQRDSSLLGSASRLTVFFQVATGALPAGDWASLRRPASEEGAVMTLEPALPIDQLEPGEWLDESSIVTGASASQLAYAIAIEGRKSSSVKFPFDVRSTALLVDKFPAEVAPSLESSPPGDEWFRQAPYADRSLLLMSLANLLATDCLREWFQQDPLTQAGRSRIPEFGRAAFGGNNSVFARNELARPLATPPARRVEVVRANKGRDKWNWVVVKGPEYKVSVADSRPGDPELELRFALTWDKAALHFHAQVSDTPSGFSPPRGQRAVELFVNPRGDGLVWQSKNDYQFAFTPTGTSMEWFHRKPVAARVYPSAHGYNVDADIPWASLGIVPWPDMDIDATASVIAAGVTESEPSLELSWRYFERSDERFGLGTLHLAP
jgi:hypothetical protein